MRPPRIGFLVGLLLGGMAHTEGSTEPPALAEASAATCTRTFTAPKLDLHGFFDVDMSARRMRSAADDSSAFQTTLGRFDLYMLSLLSERISFLGELVIEGESGSGTRIDLERAHLRYSFADWFQLTAGRMHSPVSLWNVVYHHGALLEPTVGRPVAVQFEDEGALLPLHAVGIELAGHLPAGNMQIQYTASMSHGRGATPRDVQTTGDGNRDKAIGGTLGVQFERPLSFTFGMAVHHDRTPSAANRGPELGKDLFGGHTALRTGRLELLAEAFVVRDRDRVSGESFRQCA